MTPFIRFLLVGLFLAAYGGNSSPADADVGVVRAASMVVFPPADLAYAHNPAVYARNAPIVDNVPSYAERYPYTTRPYNFAITPPLPAGLVLNTTTGVISGTPTVTLSATGFTVTGSNLAGSRTTTLTISVGPAATDIPRSNLTYTQTPVVYTKGTAITPNVRDAAGTFQQFIALAAMFRKQPEDIALAMALVRGGSSASEVIIASLGAAGTEAAQLALLALMHDAKFVAEPLRNAAGLGLLRTKNPTKASALELQGMLRDSKWREHAVLGLGTFVRRFGEAAQPSEMSQFGDVLVAELGHSTNDPDRILLLTGLSNSAYVPALASIRPYLGHAAPSLRAAAVQAIRLMQHPEVDGLIIAGMRDTESKDVRLGALDAVRNRRYTPVLAEALSERVSSDSDASVRLAALDLAVGWTTEQPTLRGVIERAATKDSDDVVQLAAQTALAALTKPTTKR